MALGTQRVNRFDQIDQVLRIIQIRHGVTALLQHLRQNAACHTVFTVAQVHQQQMGFG